MQLRRNFLNSAALFAAVSLIAPAAWAQMSPATEATGTIGGKKIQIKYSSPRMRGRKIMGGLVPFNQVWRTGADSATTLSTEANLQIGDLKVPKGNYTVFTNPTATEWTLILNKELGQWGLDYKQKLDFGRTKMTVKSLPAAVENFTIAVKSTGANTGVLTMTWEKTEASVPITVVP
jgi:hypothetical protein